MHEYDFSHWRVFSVSKTNHLWTLLLICGEMLRLQQAMAPGNDKVIFFSKILRKILRWRGKHGMR